MRDEIANRRTVPVGLPGTAGEIGMSNALRALTVMPLAGVGLLLALPIFLPDFYIKLGEGGEAPHRALILLMLVGMAAFALAIELDIRLARKLGPRADDARTSLAISTSLTVILFVVWIGVAAEKARVQAMDAILFVWMPVIGICVPLLWFTARTMVLGIHRAVLLAGFVGATAAVELGFTAQGGELDERIFTWHSLLIALALALRLWTWGIKEFRA